MSALEFARKPFCIFFVANLRNDSCDLVRERCWRFRTVSFSVECFNAPDQIYEAVLGIQTHPALRPQVKIHTRTRMLAQLPPLHPDGPEIILQLRKICP